MKIGLVGEAPSDTDSIKNILNKRFPGNEYIELIRGVTGSNLDNPRIKGAIRKEFEQKKPQLVIFIRDLDSLKTDKNKLNARKEYFESFRGTVSKNKSSANRGAIYLLNIVELEALILADINAFNIYYNINHTYTKDPTKEKDPKKYLRNLARANLKKYSEGINPKIFLKINWDTLIENCSYFQEFDRQLTSLLK